MATAESTRAGWSICSSAPSIASAFITVASMPIESARARSIPLSAPWSPRKKLPPPTTTATCTPSSAAALRSPAMRCRVGACRPCVSGPISASPDSLTTTRLNNGCGAFDMEPLLEPSIAPPAAARRPVQPLRAIKKRPQGPLDSIARPSGLFRRLLDAFAQRVTYEPGYGDRRADRLFGFLDRLSDSLRGIMDIGLIEEADLLIEGLEAGFDDLLDHVCRLAGVLLGQHGALARNHRRIEPGGVERDRTGGGDMHGDLPPERAKPGAIACGSEPNDDPDSAKPVGDRPVHVMADRAFGHSEALRATQRHVFADGGDGVGDRLSHRAAAWVMRAEHRHRVDVGRVVERDREHAAHQRLEVVVASDEVSLGIDLDKDADIVLDGGADKTLGRHSPTLLGRLGEALLSQPIDRRLDVALGLAQRILAIHHARAGLFAQILDQSGANRRHARPSFALKAPRAA